MSRRRVKDGEPFRLAGSANYYADQYDAATKRWRRRSTGMTTLRSARSVARRWLDEGEAVASGAAPAPVANLSYLEHLDDFLGAKARDPEGFTAKHMRELRRRLERLAEAGKWTVLEDIGEQEFLTALETIEGADEAAEEHGFSPATKNAYRAAAKAFTRWAHQEGRAKVDPLGKLPKWAVRGYRTFRRRPFTREELATLVVMTRRREGTLEGMSGPDRAMLYLVAVATGFRLSELGSLTRRAFKLAATPPYVELEAKDSKDGKPHQQSLVPRGLSELRFVVEELGRWLEGRPLDARCWQVGQDAGGMIRRDLAAAGLKIEPAPGERVDFHCLRGTLGRWLADAGVPMAMAQRILRHSDPKLTADHYTHLGIQELTTQDKEDARDLRTMAAAGTAVGEQAEADGASGGHCATLAQCGTTPEDSGQTNTTTATAVGGQGGDEMERESPGETGPLTSADDAGGTSEANASSRTRTLNPLIKSQGGADCHSAENKGDGESGTDDHAQFLRKGAPPVVSTLAGRETDPDATPSHARDRAEAGLEPDLATAFRRVERLAEMARPGGGA